MLGVLGLKLDPYWLKTGSMGLVEIWCVTWNVCETSEMKSCVVMRTSWQECVAVVHRALLGFQSDHTSGYKTQHGLRAFNKSLTTQTIPLSLYLAFLIPLNMHSTNNNQFHTSRGNTISCPVSGRRDLLPSWHLVAGGYDELIGTNPLVQLQARG